MRIVADSGILSVKESFSSLGELVLVDGRQISDAELRGADALLVRSVTRVDQRLLRNSSVRFVGTATSGTDHVDLTYLNDRGIRFCDARGSNANAVTEYCFAVLALLEQSRNWRLPGKLFSVIGAGRVGGLFARKLCLLGMQCVAFDPFIKAPERTALEAFGVQFLGFREALQADFISFHVPLTRSGSYPTHHQLAATDIKSLPGHSVLLNTSRGPVIANADLKRELNKRDDLTVILDVWETEPDLDTDLLNRVFLGTPHIAGYSHEAKLNATSLLLNQFCEFFSIEPPMEKAGPAGNDLRQFPAGDQPFMAGADLCSQAILDVLPLVRIDEQLRDAAAGGPERLARAFDLVRRQLAGRREFSAYRVAEKNLSPEQQRVLEVLGFSVSQH